MKNFMAWVEKFLVPIAAKIGGNRHLSALRDGFVATIAVMMAGSFVTLINNLPPQLFGGWDYKLALNNLTGGIYGNFIGQVWWGTMAMTTLFVVVSISYALAKSYGEEDIAAPIIALCSYLSMAPQFVGENWGGIPWSVTNNGAMMAGILVAFISTEMFIKLRKSDKLRITMPDGVPPAVGRAFEKLLPGMITLLVMGLIGGLTLKLPGGNLSAFITATIAKPLQGAADTLGGAMLIPFLNQFLWFFGLHGSNILTGFLAPLLGPLLEQNQAIINGVAGGEMAVLAGPFLDAFVYMGGSGSTLGFVIAILLTSKSVHHKEVAKLGLAPAAFNINEPIIFGMPLVLNPVFAIPFIFTPVILSAVAYTAIKIGLVSPVIAAIPWTAPAGLGGFLATASFSGLLLSLFNLALSIVIYLPFVVIASNIEQKSAAAEKAAEVNSI